MISYLLVTGTLLKLLDAHASETDPSNNIALKSDLFNNREK